MYRIHTVDSAEWSIADLHGRVAFRGSPQACEDWLDLQENLAAAVPPSDASAEVPQECAGDLSRELERRIEAGTPMFPFNLRKLAGLFTRSRLSRSKTLG